jgi:phosphoenolpyruvate carboxylase
MAGTLAESGSDFTAEYSIIRAVPASDELADELLTDVQRLSSMLDATVRGREGDPVLELVDSVRRTALAGRSGLLVTGRTALADRLAALELGELETVAHTFTVFFHLINSAEEQHRLRILRRRDHQGAPPDGSIAAGIAELARDQVPADEVRKLLGRLFVMPVLTAHPTEARRRTVLGHLTDVAHALDELDDPRAGARSRRDVGERLREAIVALYCTDDARHVRPTPGDEVKAGAQVFEQSLLEVTPDIYRELEQALAGAYPGEPFTVPTFLRYGTWIGGDRDGNPNVDAEVTRGALDLQRRVALQRHIEDANALGREISVSSRHLKLPPELEASIAADRTRLPEVAALARRYAGEPWREKLWYVRARLQRALDRRDSGYPDARSYLDDLELIDRTLTAPGLEPLRRGRLYDARRRAEVFGFHLATLDLRQHSAVHERAVAELLAAGGVDHYADLPEPERVALLARLLERADVGAPRERTRLLPATRELLDTLDVVGRARRDSGSAACERYVVSFTRSASDLLEVLFLARAARLAPDELRPVPLLEQLEDLERAQSISSELLALAPMRAALRGEMEVMVGYSDSSKQAGYVASAVALERAQRELAAVADEHGVMLTIFHGRGGAIGRGGGPASRSIRAQPPTALRGRLRVTEQGETVTARYARPEIARRDLEQMVSAVVTASLLGHDPAPATLPERDRLLRRAADSARAAYDTLVGDGERLARYALAATPIEEIAELPIASRPSSRSAKLTLSDLRAIPWVFSWAQSRHGVPGWFGLGSALETLIAEEGLPAVRQRYREWPFFEALVDNAQIALTRSDIDVARQYARLADPEVRTIFDLIEAEHGRTMAAVLQVTGAKQILAAWPTIAATVERRNPYVDVLSHAQITLLERLRAAGGEERERVRRVLFITINGIAAGLQTAG